MSNKSCCCIQQNCLFWAGYFSWIFRRGIISREENYEECKERKLKIKSYYLQPGTFSIHKLTRVRLISCIEIFQLIFFPSYISPTQKLSLTVTLWTASRIEILSILWNSRARILRWSSNKSLHCTIKTTPAIHFSKSQVIVCFFIKV